jgi:Tfp pilus assembly protein PilZ
MKVLPDENNEDILSVKFKNRQVIQDKFTHFVMSGDIKVPEPSSRLVDSVLLDLKYRERTKISKIKSLEVKSQKFDK